MLKKYDICETISSHPASKVVLLKHKILGEHRILKIISKEYTGSSHLTEAEILLNLSHPGIPIIYDLEEDDGYFYLIEEYVKGVSVKEHLLNHRLSHGTIVDIAVKMCEILEYLHTLSTPVYYNDMKLEHIFLCEDRVRLVDFGISGYASSCMENITYGTKSYLAPEVLKGACSEKSDIYSLAECLMRMYETSSEGDDRRIFQLIKRGKSENPDSRPGVSEYLEMWKKLRIKENYCEGRHKKSIFVVGSDRSVGTTHIAIATCCMLNYYGWNYVYENAVNPYLVQRMAENDPGFYEKDFVYHEFFKGAYPGCKGELLTSEYGRVVDCGTDLHICDTTETFDADIVIFVIGTSAWQSEALPERSFLNRAICLCNPANKLYGAKLAKRIEGKVFGFLPDGDAFSITKEKKALFMEIKKRIDE